MVKIPTEIKIAQELQDYDMDFKILVNEYHNTGIEIDDNDLYKLKNYGLRLKFGLLLNIALVIGIVLWLINTQNILYILPFGVIVFYHNLTTQRRYHMIQDITKRYDEVMDEQNASAKPLLEKYPTLLFLNDGYLNTHLQVAVKQSVKGEEITLENLINNTLDSKRHSLEDPKIVELFQHLNDLNQGHDVKYDPDVMYYYEVDELNDLSSATVKTLTREEVQAND